VRTIAEYTQRHIAVMAKNPETGGVVVPPEPYSYRHAVDFFVVFISAAVDMVNGKKFKMQFTAASTLSAIVGNSVKACLVAIFCHLSNSLLSGGSIVLFGFSDTPLGAIHLCDPFRFFKLNHFLDWLAHSQDSLFKLRNGLFKFLDFLFSLLGKFYVIGTFIKDAPLFFCGDLAVRDCTALSIVPKRFKNFPVHGSVVTSGTQGKCFLDFVRDTYSCGFHDTILVSF
jgi:hypothetical protein